MNINNIVIKGENYMCSMQKLCLHVLCACVTINDSYNALIATSLYDV